MTFRSRRDRQLTFTSPDAAQLLEVPSSCGAKSGLVVAYFIVDAHLSRLRDKPLRAFVRDRLRFPEKRVAKPAVRLLAAAEIARRRGDGNLIDPPKR